MYAAGQKEMQMMDQYTMEHIGLPGVVLMENAGAKVVDEIIKEAPDKQAKIAILAGGGNNGGDGFVIARRLYDLGYEPVLFLLVPKEKLKGDAKVHFAVYENRGLPYIEWDGGAAGNLEEELGRCDVIVDAMLGTGVKGAVREPFQTAIRIVNRLRDKLVIAVDVPSGVNSDDGTVDGVAVKADKTITFVFPKKGFFLKDGPKYVGEWKAVPISVPPSIADQLNLGLPEVITEELAKACVPVRTPSGHKGTFGHALVIGGSEPYVGAPVFTAKAAFHCGAGLVTLAVSENIYPIAAAQNPESLYMPLPEADGHFAPGKTKKIVASLEKFDAVAIGPGMGRFQGGDKWLKDIVFALNGQPVVIDADALYLLRKELKSLRKIAGPVIMTPHPGEMAHLIQKTVPEVEGNRLEVAREFAVQYGVYLLLKGHRSVIAAPDGKIFICPHGHDALGKGGSGDILTGMIVSFLAQGADPAEALVAASFLHARAGERKSAELSRYGVTPLHLIDAVKEQLNEWM